MVSKVPNVDVNGRYSVAQTCKLLGIHRNTLINYTKAGKIRCGFHRANMRKFYLGKEVVRFWNSQL
ncbi:MAG: helix-turn-helix domain-containing protein [Bacteroidales bacterium]|nr:helix-turn-helix domain-containing protein [Bacteroidales bacterium]